MRLELDEAAMKGLVSEAIFQSLDEQKREALIRSALEALLLPNAEGYGRGKSPLQAAFEQALYRKANEIAADALSNRPEITKAVDDLVMDALRKFMGEKRDEMIEQIADGIRKAITGDRY